MSATTENNLGEHPVYQIQNAQKNPRRADILLAAANAGYIHCSFSLRCILANLGELSKRTIIVEGDSRDLTPIQWADRLLLHHPRVIGFSVYIWNVTFIIQTMRVLREIAPEVALAVGGPELAPTEPNPEIESLADAIIYGEAEGVAAEIFGKLLSGERKLGALNPAPPDPASLKLPYHLYSDRDLAERLTYLESSRGCPYRCAYCTSADSGGIRFFDLDNFLPALGDMLRRGARHLKFLDRSFNRGGDKALAVLEFLLAQPIAGRVMHFEFTPERIPPEWRSRLLRFEPGALHLEVGVQTWNTDVAKRIRRALNREIVNETLDFLINEAKADVHADLIAGLPGEGMESFALGFDHLVSHRPSELQVGILKSLPGTAIREMSEPEGLIFSPAPPYEILQTPYLAFREVQSLSRFSHCWDLLYNRRRFDSSAPLLWQDGVSPFKRVMELTESLFAEHGRLHALSPRRLAEAMLEATPAAGRDRMRASLERDAREFAKSRKK